jgi:energy-coupling factor transporter ATP-binding protein EcfA2
MHGSPSASPVGGAAAAELDFAAFDQLVESLDRWSAGLPEWPPATRVRAEWDQVAPRLDRARRELSRVLVVGVIGGTGTGKSTLVNALAGREVTAAGDVARPTTTCPVIVAAPDVDLSWLPVDAMQGRVVRSDAPAVSHIVLIDCPDPDTQGEQPAAPGAPEPARDTAANRNRDLLEAVLPACDVLLLVATAQKYRSWIVAREVRGFAPGRPLLFVQTHAGRDPDIRTDWRAELESQGFEVPRIFRVDGVDAAARRAAGLEPDAGFADLVTAIDGELAGRAARRVRRTGAIDLAHWFTQQAAGGLEPLRAAVGEFAAGVQAERARLESLLVRDIGDKLRTGRSAWQRLLGDEIVERWQGGPFASFLHAVAVVGGLWGRVRPGNGVIGRLLAGRPADEFAAGRGWQALDDIGLKESEVEQSRSILAGLAARARIGEPLIQRARIDPGRVDATAAAVLERTGRWLGGGIEQIVADRRSRTGGRLLHGIFEALFAALVVIVLIREARGFFYGYLWQGQPPVGASLPQAIVWLVLWGLLLRWLLMATVRAGLDRDITTFVSRLPAARLVDPLLADFETAAERISRYLADAARLAAEAESLGATLGEPVGLGRFRGGDR